MAVFLALALEFSAGRIKVVHDPAEARLAGSLAAKAEEALARLEARFGLVPEGRVTIILASSQAEFVRAQPGRSRPPVWAAGTAYPELNLIVLKSRRASPGLDMDRVLVHELAHLVLGRLFGRHRVPTWLNEGLTMHLAGDWGISRQMVMVRALSSDRLIPLGRLVRGFPEDPFRAETAYAQSYYFLAFLRDRWGRQVVGRLIRNIGLGVSPENALLQASGLRPEDLEEEFSEWLSKRFSLFWIVTHPAAVWFLAAVILAAALVARRRASARKLAEWEKEDDGAENDSVGSRGPG